MALVGELAVRLKLRQTGDNDIATPDFAPKLERLLSIASGVAAGQADKLFVDERTLAASATENLDLAGVLVDAFGTTIAMAEVAAIVVLADPGNANDVVVGGAASNAYAGFFGDPADTIKVPANGVFVIAGMGAAGLGAVTAATGDLLKVANGGAGSSVKYIVAIVGRSA